ncbi:MAG: YIP1 family protein [Mariprofundaceae bacterium]
MSDRNIIYFDGNQPTETLIPTIRALLFQPREFFAAMPKAIFYRNGLFFVTVIVFALSFLSIPFHSMAMLFLVPVTWGTALIGMRFLGAYLRWAVATFAKTRLTSVNAFQICAYAFLPMLLSPLSWLGVVGLLWSIYLLWLGLVAHCRISAGAALTIVSIPVSLLIIAVGVFLAAMSNVVIR